MKNPSSYLKLKVLGAIDYAQGTSIRDRIRNVSETTFTDEGGHPRRFTWRTISTWLYRYKVDGVTSMMNKKRSDAGKTRKLLPEELLEALNQVLPQFRQKGRWPNEVTDELFFCEESRKVKKDNTFSFQSRRYETLVDLHGHEIQLRYDRRRGDTAAIVIYHKGQRIGVARLLDTVANGLLRRKELP